MGRGVQRTGDAEAGFLHDVSVDLGGGDVGVTEKFLDGADIVARFKKVSGKGMPEGVAADGLGNAGNLDGVADSVRVNSTAVFCRTEDLRRDGRRGRRIANPIRGQLSDTCDRVLQAGTLRRSRRPDPSRAGF